MRLQQHIANFTVLVALAGFTISAYYVVRPDLSGGGVRVFLVTALAFSALVLVRPRLGLFGLCVGLLFIPFEWRIPGLKFTSPAVMFVGAAFGAWATSVAMHRSSINPSKLYVPVAAASVVTWLNLIRYGTSFYNFPLIFSEALIIFLLVYHVIVTRRHLSQLLVVLAVALTLRNAIDVGMTIASIEAGDVLGAIRQNELIAGGTSTTQSHLRSVMLPLFIAGVILMPTRRTRALFGLAVLVEVAWLSLASTRTGMIGLVLSPALVFAVMPAGKRRGLLLLLPAVALVAVVLSVVYSGAWSGVRRATERDIEGGFGAGRPANWKEGLSSFSDSPWIGDHQGGAHSFILGAAQTMGLPFLLPFGIVAWIVWRHGLWLRGRRLDPASETLVVGMLAALLLAVPLNLVGTMFNGFVAFFFWLLVGMLEAVYLDARGEHYRIVPRPPQVPEHVSREAGGAKSAPLSRR